MGAMSRNGMVCAWSAWLHSAPLARTILFCANELPQVDRISNTKVSTRLSFLKPDVISVLTPGKTATVGKTDRNCSRTIRSRNQAKLPHRGAKWPDSGTWECTGKLGGQQCKVAEFSKRGRSSGLRLLE